MALRTLYNITGSHSKHRLWRMAQAVIPSGSISFGAFFSFKLADSTGTFVEYSLNAENSKEVGMAGR